MAADAVAPTGDADKDRRAAKLCVQLHFHSDLFDDRTRTDTIVYPPSSVREELEKLKKNQARRLNRKKALEDADSKPVTSRKCANCGAVGHMSAFPSRANCRFPSRSPVLTRLPAPRTVLRDEPKVSPVGRVQPDAESSARDGSDGTRYGCLWRGRPPSLWLVHSSPVFSLSLSRARMTDQPTSIPPLLPSLDSCTTHSFSANAPAEDPPSIAPPPPPSSTPAAPKLKLSLGKKT